MNQSITQPHAPTGSHIGWIDTMKVAGMFLIVVGHMFPTDYEIINTFSVPLFFIISGMLAKPVDPTMPTPFWRKTWAGLIAPMLIYCSLSMLYYRAANGTLADTTMSGLWEWARGILSGRQGGNRPGTYPGLSACWFIYSLIVIRAAHHYVPRRLQLWVLLPMSIVLPMIWHVYQISFQNAWANAVVCYPLFIAGTMLRPYLDRMGRFNAKSPVALLSAAAALAVVWMLPDYNGWPELYLNYYGRYYWLFLLGSVAGTYLIFVLARLLSDRLSGLIATLAAGNILILGLHQIPMAIFWDPLGIHHPLACALAAAAIMAVMLPLIWLSRRYFPLAVGNRRAIRRAATA